MTFVPLLKFYSIIMSYAVELCAYIGIEGCACPISMSMICMCTSILTLIKSAPNFTFPTEGIMVHMICMTLILLHCLGEILHCWIGKSVPLCSFLPVVC